MARRNRFAPPGYWLHLTQRGRQTVFSSDADRDHFLSLLETHSEERGVRIAAPPFEENRGARIGIDEGGWRAAESLVLARYAMFTQVYFHKTRIAYDIHFGEALKAILPKEGFPKPDKDGLGKYLEWDDWKVLGELI